MNNKSQTSNDPQPKSVSARSLRGLDALNFFLADVRDGLGPYLGIYLLATHNWDAASIGVAMSASTFAGVVAQTPAGWLIDRLRQKRFLIAICSLIIAVGCVAMVIKTNMTSVIFSQIVIGVAAALIAPAVAAVTLGLVGHRRLERRVGRNEAFNHAGNVAAAALAGLLGHYVGREYIFYLVAAMAVASIVSILFVNGSEINHDVARGAAEKPTDSKQQPDKSDVSSIKALFKDRRVLIFAVAVTLFHFANAAMLPLVGQTLADGKDTGASLYMSACIITAQLVMIPVSAYAGRAAGTRGRKPVFLIAFLALPLRGVLYTMSDNPYFLVSVQILDGVAAGIFGVLMLIIIADLTRGTGRFNLAQGAIGTAVGLGASLSNVVAGYVVNRAGYDAGFLMLSGVALIALLIFWFFVPETKGEEETNTPPHTQPEPVAR